MNIVPPKLQQSQIAIVRKNPPNNPLSNYNHNQHVQPPQNNHRLSPAAKIVFHSPPTRPLNNYLNHLVPNNGIEQQLKYSQHEKTGHIIKTQQSNFIPYAQKKNVRTIDNFINSNQNQRKNQIKIISMGNVSSAATRSRGISQISQSKSQQNRSLLTQVHQIQYKKPQNPVTIFKNVPVRRISKHNITVSQQNRSNRSTSQNIHITIESKEATPLPSLITVTQKAPIVPPILIQHQTRSNLHIKTENFNPIPTNIHFIKNNLQIGNQVINQQQIPKNIQINNIQTPYQAGFFQSGNIQESKEGNSSNLKKSNNKFSTQRRNEFKSQNKEMLSKSTFIEKLNNENNTKEYSPKKNVLSKNLNREKLFSQSAPLQQFNEIKSNKNEFFKQQYNHQYYNIQLPSNSEKNSQTEISECKGNSIYLYQEKLYMNSKRLINEIFENETNKALLKLSRIQIRSRDKSGRHKKLG